MVPRRGKFNLTELRRKLSQYLTPFMIPEFFVAIPSLPMTPNGKVDRKSLPVVLKEGALYESAGFSEMRDMMLLTYGK